MTWKKIKRVFSVGKASKDLAFEGCQHLSFKNPCHVWFLSAEIEVYTHANPSNRLHTYNLGIKFKIKYEVQQ